jgi:hypothetical protein
MQEMTSIGGAAHRIASRGAPLTDVSIELIGKYFRVAQFYMAIMIGTEKPDC